MPRGRAPGARDGRHGHLGPLGRHGHLGRAVAGVACALWLAGCATPPAPRLPGADGILSWWSGRFAVAWNDPGIGEERSASGRFTLSEDGQRVELELYSPFGQTVARATSAPDGAHLDTADGRSFAAPDAESLTALALGWRMPIGSLPAWLRGDVGVGAPAAPTDPAATEPREAIASGWAIRIEPGPNGRPARMALRWPAAGAAGDARRVSIRLVVDGDPATTQP